MHGVKRDPEIGLQTGLVINEHATLQRQTSWYRSFRFACGAGASRCTRAEIANWRQGHSALPRGVLDPCGSVMIRQVSFGGGRARRDDREYQDLTLRFTMKVYGFAPHRLPGSPECRAPLENR